MFRCMYNQMDTTFATGWKGMNSRTVWRFYLSSCDSGFILVLVMFTETAECIAMYIYVMRLPSVLYELLKIRVYWFLDLNTSIAWVIYLPDEVNICSRFTSGNFGNAVLKASQLLLRTRKKQWTLEQDALIRTTLSTAYGMAHIPEETGQRRHNSFIQLCNSSNVSYRSRKVTDVFAYHQGLHRPTIHWNRREPALLSNMGIHF